MTKSITRLVGTILGRHYSYRDLAHFLHHKNVLTTKEKKETKSHIDNCSLCWEIWNRVRWDAAWTKQGVQELAEYLGAEFEKYLDSSWGLAYDWYQKNPKTEEQIKSFYENTRYFVYNTVIFYESGDRMDFKPILQNIISKYSITSALDYGCGVGNDGLEMLNRGIKTAFADFRSPSTTFLRWRLNSRGIDPARYQIIDVNETQRSYPSVDMIWMIDVLEHMVNPIEALKTISDTTKLFVYYTDSDDKAGGRHPFHFPINTQQLEGAIQSYGFDKIENGDVTIWGRKHLL